MKLDTPLLGQLIFRPKGFEVGPKHEPTPEEIAAMTAEIRKGWSKAQEQSRRMIANEKWTVAEVQDFYRRLDCLSDD